MTEELPDFANELELSAHETLIEGVKAGDAEAQYQLASELMPDLSVTTTEFGDIWLANLSDDEDWRLREAVKLYSLSWAQGHKDAELELERLFNHSYSCSFDDERSIALFRIAADAGFSGAQYQLAQALSPSFLDPAPTDEIRKEMVKCYSLAAKQGHTESQLSLGYLYTDTNWQDHDNREAVKWYELAANNGAIEAINQLATLYYQFANKTKSNDDYFKARHWSLIAFEKYFSTDEKERNLIENYELIVSLGRNLTKMLANGLGGDAEPTQAEEIRKKYLSLASDVQVLMENPNWNEKPF